jgi:hypothetical protein
MGSDSASLYACSLNIEVAKVEHVKIWMRMWHEFYVSIMDIRAINFSKFMCFQLFMLRYSFFIVVIEKVGVFSP